MLTLAWTLNPLNVAQRPEDLPRRGPACAAPARTNITKRSATSRNTDTSPNRGYPHGFAHFLFLLFGVAAAPRHNDRIQHAASSVTGRSHHPYNAIWRTPRLQPVTAGDLSAGRAFRGEAQHLPFQKRMDEQLGGADIAALPQDDLKTTDNTCGNPFIRSMLPQLNSDAHATEFLCRQSITVFVRIAYTLADTAPGH